MYEYNENDGAIDNIEVVLNAPVAQNFTVYVTGGTFKNNINTATDYYQITVTWYEYHHFYYYNSGPGSQPSSVIVSGPNYNQTLTFVAGGSLKQTLSVVQLKDDEVAREQHEIYNIYIYNITLTNLSHSDVMLINDDIATLKIKDNDGISCLYWHDFILILISC